MCSSIIILALCTSFESFDTGVPLTSEYCIAIGLDILCRSAISVRPIHQYAPMGLA